MRIASVLSAVNGRQLLCVICVAVLAALLDSATPTRVEGVGLVAAYQTCEPEIETEGNLSELVDPPKVLRENCVLQQNSYVEIHPDIKIHGRADVSGHCIRQILSGYPPVCQVYYDQYRTIAGISVHYQIPGEGDTWFSAGPIYGKNPSTGATMAVRPTLNSEDLVNSFGPRSIGLSALGKWTIREQSTINTTLCNIGPSTSPVRLLSFYAVWCAPIFDPNNERLPIGQTIKISSESAFAQAAEAAAQGWETILNSYGISIDFSAEPCASGTNPYCIWVVQAPIPENPTACSAVRTNYDQTGLINQSSTIVIPNTSNDPERLVQLISHELGHLLGLEDKLCGRDKSVMWTPELEGGPCDYTAANTTEALTATITDALPVANSVYPPSGEGSKATCPVQ
jgi:hypothetical protein